MSDRILLTDLLDTEMDRVQKYMKEWGGADWSLRQHSDLRVSQVWFIKVDGLSDGELTDHIYKLCGYDHLTGRKTDYTCTSISPLPRRVSGGLRGWIFGGCSYKLFVCQRPPLSWKVLQVFHSPNLASLACAWYEAKSACLVNWNDRYAKP